MVKCEVFFLGCESAFVSKIFKNLRCLKVWWYALWVSSSRFPWRKVGLCWKGSKFGFFWWCFTRPFWWIFWGLVVKLEVVNFWRVGKMAEALYQLVARILFVLDSMVFCWWCQFLVLGTHSRGKKVSRSGGRLWIAWPSQFSSEQWPKDPG